VVAFSVPKSAIPIVVMREIMFGMTFGLAARFIFFAVDMAGNVMASATGLSMAATFNPEIGPSTDISRLYTNLAMLLFLAMDIHHDLIIMFVKSYEWLPVGTLNVANLVPLGISFAAKIFIIGLKLSAPVVIVMLVTNLILGFIYKAVPTLNIFFVGQPLYIVLGLFTMMLCIPMFAFVMGGYFNGIKDEMGRVILLMKG
jgi:flagellar biosynthesis protein FliR